MELTTISHVRSFEKGRWNKTPIENRVCKFCDSGEIGDEFHFAMICKTFDTKRNCFIGKMESIKPGFKSLSSQDQFKTICVQHYLLQLK